ncbi:hypothetical protein UVUMRFZT_CDS0134 [Staphylococcus phage LJLAME001]
MLFLTFTLTVSSYVVVNKSLRLPSNSRGFVITHYKPLWLFKVTTTS